MCGYEDILKSDTICVPIDINGNLIVEVDIPVWMRERLFNMGQLNMLEGGKIVSLYEGGKEYVFMIVKRN